MGASAANRSKVCRYAAASVAAAGLVLALTQPAYTQARTELQGALAGEQDVPQTLAGCSLPLPGGRDRDSGLAGQYISDRQGQPYLFAPSLTARQTYSDNVTLAPEGEEESDHISQLIPAFSFCQIRQRTRTQVDYQAQLLHYWEDSDRNDVYHYANVDNTTTLMQDFLFLDLGARYDQQPTTISGVLTGDNELVTGDRQDTTTLRASPYAFQSLGPVGDSVTRYEFRRTMYDEDARDTTRHIGSFNVTSPGAADPLSWQGNVRTERVTRDDIDDATYFDDGFIELGYRAIGRLTLLARGGLETVNRADGRDRFGNEYWEAGFRWSDERTSVEARYGERFFGDTYFAAISRRGGSFTARLDYRETQEIPDRIGAGVPDIPPGLENFIDIPEPELTISKRLTASGTYETGLSTFRVTAFDDRRELVVSGDERRRYGADASWRWSFAPRTTLTPRLTWERIDDRDGQIDTLRGARLSVARMLDRHTQAGATIRRQDRTSDIADQEYVENAITLELTRLF
ncbi:TIGR03016 family PEP-CTERM system-associated outer membrane protein [Aquisalimonas sp. 2447]|uniref:TIGR03016 family PEP-CTERM system-associated outer membrane protein n=1 Tax=Aquisalimonas sp. 2447 TaxID=2740807 RepID=UPI00143237A5|nr:TIGR03016 family PEP-CTERM system-associated outer membrane protein [Aquisalimonas sp. 2447]QIT56544.1 TIGR03016 family PEP-CTERM system-associated outer membrane protein [Aquisalimonas sp. 2447]